MMTSSTTRRAPSASCCAVFSVFLPIALATYVSVGVSTSYSPTCFVGVVVPYTRFCVVFRLLSTQYADLLFYLGCTFELSPHVRIVATEVAAVM